MGVGDVLVSFYDVAFDGRSVDSAAEACAVEVDDPGEVPADQCFVRL